MIGFLELTMFSFGTILLADENPDDVLLMRCALRKAGFDGEIIEFGDGLSVVQFLKAQSFSTDSSSRMIVMLDVRHPRLDVFSVLRWIRARDETRNLPVVLLSGYRNGHQMQHALDLGADLWLEKPLSYWELTQVVEGQVNNLLEGENAAA